MNITRTRKQNCNRVRSDKIKAPSWKSLRSNELKTAPARYQPDLVKRIYECMVELGKSKYYQAFYKQINKHGFRSKMEKVLGKEKKFRVLLSSLENIFYDHSSKIQLAFALILKGNNDWIGEIQIFSPVLYKDWEVRALDKLGFTLSHVNEEGKVELADVPTLAILPHNCPFLYNDLLQANWNSNLNNLVILGSSFTFLKRYAERKPTEITVAESKYIFQSQKMYLVEEVSLGSFLKDIYYPFYSFCPTSFHIFTVYPYCLPLNSP